MESTITREPVHRVGPLTIDTYLRQVTLRGEALYLTPKEYDLLCVLAREPKRVVPKHELYRLIWGCEPFGRTLDSHAGRLRAKLGVQGDRFVVAVWAIGYRLADSLLGEAA